MTSTARIFYLLKRARTSSWAAATYCSRCERTDLYETRSLPVDKEMKEKEDWYKRKACLSGAEGAGQEEYEVNDLSWSSGSLLPFLFYFNPDLSCLFKASHISWDKLFICLHNSHLPCHQGDAILPRVTLKWISLPATRHTHTHTHTHTPTCWIDKSMAFYFHLNLSTGWTACHISPWWRVLTEILAVTFNIFQHRYWFSVT